MKRDYRDERSELQSPVEYNEEMQMNKTNLFVPNINDSPTLGSEIEMWMLL